MKDKSELEFGTRVTVFGEHGTIFDLCENNEKMVKVLMATGRFPGTVMLVVLNKLKKGFQ
jgi:hypothetical protein